MLDVSVCGVESVVFRYLKLLKYVQKINLSPEDTLALMHRLETDGCRPEDYEVLMRIVEAHMELSGDVLQAVPALEPTSLAPKAKGRRQGTKRTRHRHRR
jgi:hypothetical protein